MTINNIAAYRLINQQIAGTTFTTPKQIVGWLGAVQAQDYAMAKWAVGLRLPNATDELIEQALNNGEIVRTHILRPTWHFVTGNDIRWILALTAPRINAAAVFMYRQLELDTVIFNKSNSIIEKLLQGKELTRAEIMKALEKNGIKTNELRAAHLMLRAELDGVVCNGSRRGKQFTYALLDEKVPITKTITKEEALAELANRYFSSHGPATLYDFSWWSGLPVTEAKLALEMIKMKLVCQEVGKQKYWFCDVVLLHKHHFAKVYLLPAFDEFMVSYKDRSASLDPVYSGNAITSNGIFKPVILVNGKVAGTWSRTQKKDNIIIRPFLFQPIGKMKENSLAVQAKRYATFLELQAVLR